MKILLRDAIRWIRTFGYSLHSNGYGYYWVFTAPSTTLPGAMGIYVGYLSPIDVLCLAADLRELAADEIREQALNERR